MEVLRVALCRRLSLSPTDESDYSPFMDRLVGNVGNDNREECFTVEIVDDLLVEVAQEAFTLTLAAEVLTFNACIYKHWLCAPWGGHQCVHRGVVTSVFISTVNNCSSPRKTRYRHL